jgi:hypothetical protein
VPECLPCTLLKGKLYTNKPPIIKDQKENSNQDILPITAHMLRVCDNVEHCIQLCMDTRSDHIQYLIWWDAVPQEMRYFPTSDHH